MVVVVGTISVATTIADINAGQVADVTSKYVRLENVNVTSVEEYGTVTSTLTDGTNELVINNTMWTLPEDMLSIEKFNNISGIVMYGYYGLEFVPYGTYDAVEKQIEYTEVANIAALKANKQNLDVKLAANNLQVTVFEKDMRGRTTIYIQDETGGIQINDENNIFTELGQTFNGSLKLVYDVDQEILSLETTSKTAKSEYSVEVKDVMAKEVTLAAATAAENDQILIKLTNMTSATKKVFWGEGEEDYYEALVITDGNNEIMLSDMFNKVETDENRNPILPEHFNATGIVMEMYGEYYFVPTGVGIEEVKVEEVADLRKWDFTAWSEETKANLAAEAALYEPATEGVTTLWRSYEKDKADKNGNYEPNETNGNAYWYGTAISGSEELAANGNVIAETKGLLFNTMVGGALAIAIDYPETSLGTYEGPSYLWIGSKNNSFTIPSVKSGSKITLGVESHKNSDARGVTLAIDGTEIGRAVPTTYEVFNITVPGELTDNVMSDVVVTNTNGCHIYFITVDATGTEDGISNVNATFNVVNNNVYTINGVKVRNAGDSLEGLAKGIYIIGGKKVVVK